MDVGLNLGGTVTDLQPATRYYFTATALGTNGFSSVPSNEVIFDTGAGQAFISIIVETSSKPKGGVWIPCVTNNLAADSVQEYFRVKVVRP